MTSLHYDNDYLLNVSNGFPLPLFCVCVDCLCLVTGFLCKRVFVEFLFFLRTDAEAPDCEAARQMPSDRLCAGQGKLGEDKKSFAVGATCHGLCHSDIDPFGGRPGAQVSPLASLFSRA